MSIGQKLFDLRKQKHLSQEEVADKLNVSRQTISKWETDQSTPDFDKIIPLCELYEISADELLTGRIEEKEIKEKKIVNREEESFRRIRRAKGISIGIFLYFLAVAWIMVTIPVFMMNPIVASAIFLLIGGIATYFIIYTCIMYKKNKTEKEKQEDKLRKQISDIVAIITVIIYLLISFTTMAWHITWIIWIVYGLFDEILKLVFMLRGMKNEE